MAKQSFMDTRRHQMFPMLEPAEIERLRRFGEPRAYAARRGLRQGRRRWPRHDHHPVRRGRRSPSQDAERAPIADRHPRPRLLHGRAGPARRAGRRSSMRRPHGRSRRWCIPPEQLRALLIAEAELGERIMRALILRRVGLHRGGRRRPGDRRPRRRRRRAAACELPVRATAIRTSASIPNTRRRGRVP